ncbi:MAG: hypothetical protein R3E79_23070 [Caldilineaceae bacterium]
MQQKQIRLAGLACLLGGLLFFGINLLPPESSPLILDVLSVLLLVCLAGGPLGVHGLHVFGSGRVRHLGGVGVSITLFGLLVYLVGVFAIRLKPELGFLYALGALFSGIGMLLTGIAVMVARQLPGWRRFAPLLVGLYYLIMIPIQIVFLSARLANLPICCWPSGG